MRVKALRYQQSREFSDGSNYVISTDTEKLLFNFLQVLLQDIWRKVGDFFSR